MAPLIRACNLHRRQLHNLDPIYQQAHLNLTGTGHDLWKTAERSQKAVSHFVSITSVVRTSKQQTQKFFLGMH